MRIHKYTKASTIFDFLDENVQNETRPKPKEDVSESFGFCFGKYKNFPRLITSIDQNLIQLGFLYLNSTKSWNLFWWLFSFLSGALGERIGRSTKFKLLLIRIDEIFSTPSLVARVSAVPVPLRFRTSARAK